MTYKTGAFFVVSARVRFVKLDVLKQDVVCFERLI